MSTQTVPAIEKCDVIDRDRLVKYRAKRDEWLRFYELKDDEPHSIQQQIFSMIFLDLAYRVLSSPRERAGLKLAATSGLLAHFLDQGYVATQILAIRRLLDGRKDVISVRRLLDDISRHRDLLTREVYVCHGGLPYDPESWQALPRTTEMDIFGIEAPGLGDYLGSHYRHETFDHLSGVQTSGRTRDDLIKESVFQTLNNWLEESPADKLITLSHKFFAHAADKISRDSLKYSGISLADVAEVQRAIVRVERAITDELLFIGVAREVVPMPPLGLFKDLDLPYVPANMIDDMYRQWDQLTEERNKWLRGINDEL